MAELEEIMAALAEGVDGTVTVAVGGMDGLLVEQAGSSRPDLTGFIAELANVLAAGGTAMADRLESGSLEELMLVSDNHLAYVRLLSRHLWCLLLLRPDGNLGKARLLSRQAAAGILGALT